MYHNSMYNYHVDDHDILSRKEEIELLIRAISHKCQRSRDKLITHNRKFVMTTATQLHKHHSNVPITDIIGYGMLGLCHSIDKYDVSKVHQVKFTTHAVWWIRQSINKHAHECEAHIRMPMNKVSEIRESLKAQKHKVHKELSDEHTVLLNNAKSIPSIDEPLSENGLSSLVDVVSFNSYDGSNRAEDKCYRKKVMESVSASISVLPDREKRVVKLLYGLDSDQPMSMREVGVEIGLSHERVRNIRNKAFIKLKRDLKYLDA